MEKWRNPENPDKDYWIVETKDENGNKGLSGGMMKRQSQEHKVTNYITVNSIEEYTRKIEQAGGKIIVPKTEIPNMGYYEIFLDSEEQHVRTIPGKQVGEHKNNHIFFGFLVCSSIYG